MFKKKINFFTIILVSIFFVLLSITWITIIHKSTANALGLKPKLLALSLLIFILLILIFWSSKLKQSKNIKQRLGLFIITKILFSGVAYSIFSFLVLLFSTMCLFNLSQSFLIEEAYTKASIAFLSAINSIFLLYLNFLRYFPSKSVGQEMKPEKRKILIKALSTPRRGDPIETRKSYLAELKKVPCQKLIDNEGLEHINNLAPIFMAIDYHHKNKQSPTGESLEKVYILVSKEFSDNPPYKAARVGILNNEIRRTLKEKIEKCFNEGLVEFVAANEGLDFENFFYFRQYFIRFMESLLRLYDSKDISIDISGGTSIVSAALILSAIKGDIQAQYLSQKDFKTFYRINTDIFDIEDLVEEFLEKFKEYLRPEKK